MNGLYTLTWYYEGIELKSDSAVEIRPSGVLSIVFAELRPSGVYNYRPGTQVAEREVTVRPDNEEINPVQGAIPVNNFGEYVAVNHSIPL